MNATKTIQVRRNNGQNDFGPWMPVDHEDVPSWVGDLIADERQDGIHNRTTPLSTQGKVSNGGSIWTWRTA